MKIFGERPAILVATGNKRMVVWIPVAQPENLELDLIVATDPEIRNRCL